MHQIAPFFSLFFRWSMPPYPMTDSRIPTLIRIIGFSLLLGEYAPVARTFHNKLAAFFVVVVMNIDIFKLFLL